MAKSKNITYRDFANWAIMLAKGEEIEGYDKDLFIAKGEDLIKREESKSDYSKKNKKPSESKVSEETITNAQAVLSVLTTEPQTTLEIFTALDWEFDAQRSPLRLANAIRHLRKSMSILDTKKLEQVTRVKDGMKCTDTVSKTAYFLAE